MRIVFIGTIDFSQRCLESVLENGGNVAAIFTLAKETAGFHSDYADLSTTTRDRGIPVHLVQNINEPENLELIQSYQPDVIFVFGWSQLISKPILNLPPLGCIGTHPALLPRNRGRHPIVWALVEGLNESGLTFFYLDEEADSGDILWQKAFPISKEDDSASVYSKVSSLAQEGISEFLPCLRNGTAARTPQNHRNATYWRKRTRKDGEINFSDPSETIYNLVRALTRPYVGAHTYANGDEVKIWSTGLPSSPLPETLTILEPGTVFDCTDKGFNVRTKDGYLIVYEYEMEGGRTITASSRLGVSS